jgi:hypothetical protein
MIFSSQRHLAVATLLPGLPFAAHLASSDALPGSPEPWQFVPSTWDSSLASQRWKVEEKIPSKLFQTFGLGPKTRNKKVFAKEDTERNRHLCNIETTPIETTCVYPTKHRNTWVKKDTKTRYFPGNLWFVSLGERVSCGLRRLRSFMVCVAEIMFSWAYSVY